MGWDDIWKSSGEIYGFILMSLYVFILGVMFGFAGMGVCHAGDQN